MALKSYKAIRWVLPILATLALLFLAGCDYTSKQSALDPKGPLAQNQYDLFMLTVYITGILWVLVGGALIYTVIRFRARKTDDPNTLPHQSHGHAMIEVGLILVSTVVLVILAIPTFKGIKLIHEMPAKYEKDAVIVNVTGLQWWWRFEYPELGIETANELIIPAGRAVQLNLRSDDVIHSFWLPKLSGKMDLIPGQQNKLWILADEPGYFYGQCAEFCGDSHAYMLFRSIAMNAADYEAWVARQKAGALVPFNKEKPAKIDLTSLNNLEVINKGRDLFNTHCSRCHRVGEEGGVAAPNLSHIAGRSTIAAGWMENTPENLHRWILTPDAVKPGNNMWNGMPLGKLADGTADRSGMPGLRTANLTSEQVDAIVAYLQLLK
ncbi:MAG: cytochrome c oxidase subunit II [Verrucomicrobiota bacterium]|nr:cytochrome c oxidase subunit II [Verrucomicrobiota bacterium]